MKRDGGLLRRILEKTDKNSTVYGGDITPPTPPTPPAVGPPTAPLASARAGLPRKIKPTIVPVADLKCVLLCCFFASEVLDAAYVAVHVLGEEGGKGHSRVGLVVALRCSARCSWSDPPLQPATRLPIQPTTHPPTHSSSQSPIHPAPHSLSHQPAHAAIRPSSLPVCPQGCPPPRLVAPLGLRMTPCKAITA